MIEAQVHDESLFNELKQYATYYSDRTKVIVIPEKYRYLMPKDYTVNLTQSTPSIYYKKHNFYISGVDEIVKLYLGLYNLAGTSFTFRNLNKLNDLIENDIILPTNQLKQLFPSLGNNAVIKDLVCSDCGFRVNRKLQKYTNVLDLSIKEIFGKPVIKTKKYNTYLFTVYDSYIEKDRKKRDRLVVAGSYISKDGEHDLSAFLYGAVTGFQKIFKKDKKVNVILDENNKFITFAPKELDIKEEKIVSPNKEVRPMLQKLPVMLYRIAYEEIRLRELIEKKGI